jgi:hypothetical protein
MGCLGYFVLSSDVSKLGAKLPREPRYCRHTFNASAFFEKPYRLTGCFLRRQFTILHADKESAELTRNAEPLLLSRWVLIHPKRMW